MLGSKNRDYKTSNRGIGRRLKVHKMMMDDGVSSDAAFKLIVDMNVNWGRKTLTKRELEEIEYKVE